MNFLIEMLIKLGIQRKGLDYHLLRASMVIVCLFFGYQKWFEYEAQALIPCIQTEVSRPSAPSRATRP